MSVLTAPGIKVPGDYIEDVMTSVKAKNPAEPEFHQAVQEVFDSLRLVLAKHPEYQSARFSSASSSPSASSCSACPGSTITGNIQVNRGFRIEMNSAIGPYKGGLRFHPSVNLGILKFLAFEQVFKNSLTTLPMGGGKGGSDFDPKGKSDNEVMRFCQSFMTELQRHIGPDTDVPAGDIGVGGREIGFLFGQYKRLRNEFTGVLTGKGLNWGGSLIRPEATGYGCVYFAAEMLKTQERLARRQALPGFRQRQRFAIHGREAARSGREAGHVVGFRRRDLRSRWHRSREAGLGHGTEERAAVDASANMRTSSRKRSSCPPTSSWSTIRSGTSRRIAHSRAPRRMRSTRKTPRTCIKNGCKLVAEGANMPSTLEATKMFLDAKILYGPAKAANAGGVATSGLEMAQNSARLSWTREEVDDRLHKIMIAIHKNCFETAEKYGTPGQSGERRQHRRLPEGRQCHAGSGPGVVNV